ncbi:MAG: ABC transporter permease [Candidatus Zixiibacteriota bacterium]
MNSLMAIRQLFQDMKKQKLRTFMTMFGILWGTVSVVLLMGFGKGLNNHFVSRIKGLGENIMMVWPGMTSQPWEGLPRGRRIRYTERDISTIKANIDAIKRISPEFQRWSVPFKTELTTSLHYVGGVWPEFAEMRNIIPQSGGRFLNARDQAEKRRVVFLGNEAATKLFGGTDPVGQRVLVNNVPFTVVGVMQAKDQNSSYAGRDSRHAWIPSETFKTMWSNRFPNIMIVQAPTTDAMPSIKKSIYSLMASKYNFDPNDELSLGIWDTTEGFKSFGLFFSAFTVFLVAIGCLTLVTGGIGVTNIMNVVLEERTKEIGIKMALGAKKMVIMMQIMTETGILVAIGGILGFAVAAGIIYLVGDKFKEYVGTPIMSIDGTILSVVVLGVIAMASGYFPAKRAANMEPVKALKLF